MLGNQKQQRMCEYKRLGSQQLMRSIAADGAAPEQGGGGHTSCDCKLSDPTAAYKRHAV